MLERVKDYIHKFIHGFTQYSLSSCKFTEFTFSNFTLITIQHSSPSFGCRVLLQTLVDIWINKM